MACCEVRDSGEGISAEFLPHIFEKFRQADGGSARRFKGLGLGLSITKQLVEAHGGSIAVTSGGRGKGAAFTVKLPYLDPGEYANVANDRPLRGLRILAVDDEADSREYLRRLLVEQGAEIVSVASAADAVDVLSRDSPHFNLLISDIGMPDVDGYELLRRVRALGHARGGGVPAIALTAFARSEDRTRAMLAGYQVHISKPIEPQELVATVSSLATSLRDR